MAVRKGCGLFLTRKQFWLPSRLKTAQGSRPVTMLFPARPEFTPIRTLVESWYERFPAAARDDVRGGFRQNDERAHAGALFELFVHELLTRLGASVEVHVSRSTGWGSPPQPGSAIANKSRTSTSPLMVLIAACQ